MTAGTAVTESRFAALRDHRVIGDLVRSTAAVADRDSHFVVLDDDSGRAAVGADRVGRGVVADDVVFDDRGGVEGVNALAAAACDRDEVAAHDGAEPRPDRLVARCRDRGDDVVDLDPYACRRVEAVVTEGGLLEQEVAADDDVDGVGPIDGHSAAAAMDDVVFDLDVLAVGDLDLGCRRVACVLDGVVGEGDVLRTGQVDPGVLEVVAGDDDHCRPQGLGGGRLVYFELDAVVDPVAGDDELPVVDVRARDVSGDRGGCAIADRVVGDRDVAVVDRADAADTR